MVLVPVLRVDGKFLAPEAGNQRTRPCHGRRIAGESPSGARQALNTVFGRGYGLQRVQYADGVSRLTKRAQCIWPGGAAGVQHNGIPDAASSKFGCDRWDGIIGHGNQNMTGFLKRDDRRKQGAQGFGDSTRANERDRMVTHFYWDAVHIQIVA